MLPPGRWRVSKGKHLHVGRPKAESLTIETCAALLETVCAGIERASARPQPPAGAAIDGPGFLLSRK